MKPLLLTVLLIAAICAIASVFMYIGWNFGVVAAIPGTRAIGFGEALALSLVFGSIGASSRASQTRKDR